MATHNDLGRLGEDEALLYLTQKGYRLLHRNWRVAHYEIDIVAEWYGEIVFVEVKTRSKEDSLAAKEAVDLHKKKNLIAAGRAYLDYYYLRDVPYSYDIITVIGSKPPFEITHYQNAYTEDKVWKQRHYKREFEV